MKNKLSDLLQTFCDEATILRNLSKRTTQWWKYSFNHYKQFSDIEYCEEITTNSLREFFLNGRTVKQWTPDTQLSYMKGIRAFLLWLEKNKYIDTNPLLNIERPKLGKHLPKRISEQDSWLLLEGILGMKYTYRYEKYRNHAFFSLLLLTGLRLQEALSLYYGDIDLQEEVIFVRNGKGNKDRMIPICKRLKIALSQYLQERERLKKECLYFFTSLRGNKPLTQHGLAKIIVRIRKATGIYFSPHRLRHTFATMMIEKGCDLFSLSKMLGHSDIKTTTIYLSASVTHLKEQIQKHPLNVL